MEDQTWLTVAGVWLETYLAGLPDVGLNPLAVAALDEARERGMTQSIASLHRHDELRDHVAALGIADRFTEISGSDCDWSVPASKAAQIARHLALAGVRPESGLVIGDMADDAAEARQAGSRAVLVTSGDTARERLLASGFPVADSLLAAVRGVTSQAPAGV